MRMLSTISNQCALHVSPAVQFTALCSMAQLLSMIAHAKAPRAAEEDISTRGLCKVTGFPEPSQHALSQKIPAGQPALSGVSSPNSHLSSTMQWQFG